MIINPELRRNIWLEFTPQRLIVTPLIIGAILYLVYLIDIDSMLPIAYFIFIFYIFLWGTKLASESIPKEINNRTWDFQRLSVIKPWTLSWGKLLGSTVYAWYGATIALIPCTILSLQTQPASRVALQLFIIILGGLFAHSIALLCSMNALQWDKNKKVKTSFYFLTGLIFSWFFTTLTLQSVGVPKLSTYNWYMLNLDPLLFNLGSLIIFLIWSLIGIYRNMRSALQYPTLPWIWFVFTLFCMIYLSGFVFLKIENAERLQSLISNLPEYVAFSTASCLTYLALFSEKLNVITYKKIIQNIKKPKMIPRWIASFILVIIMGTWLSFSPTIEVEHIKFVPLVFISASILFILRDILIIHYFQFANNPKRARVSALFYIIVLYILAPGLATALTNSKSLALFLPIMGENWILSILAPAVQMLFMAWMVKLRWNTQSNLN